MSAKCHYCALDGVYKKKVLTAVQMWPCLPRRGNSGAAPTQKTAVNVVFDDIMICADDECFYRFADESAADEVWLRQITR